MDITPLFFNVCTYFIYYTNRWLYLHTYTYRIVSAFTCGWVSNTDDYYIAQ